MGELEHAADGRASVGKSLELVTYEAGRGDGWVSEV